ncbi:MAG: fibronectin type III domain-containing protein [Bacteroidia bacterium]|nr:fibronectin type III domain-containing protein [Bacteroidia bacterium]
MKKNILSYFLYFLLVLFGILISSIAPSIARNDGSIFSKATMYSLGHRGLENTLTNIFYPDEQPSCEVPDAPRPVRNSLAICGLGSVTIFATMGDIPGTEIRVYNAPTGGTPLAVDNTPPYELNVSINSLGLTTFYLESYNAQGGGCASFERIPVEVYASDAPSIQPPIAGNVTTCRGGVAVFTIIADNFLEGDYISVYDEAGFFVNNIASEPLYFRVPGGAFQSSTYYMEHNRGDCGSGLVPLVVNVVDPSASFISISPQDPVVCEGQTLQLTASPAVPGAFVYQWYQGDNLAQSSSSLRYTRANMSPTDAGLYEVWAIAFNCTSSAAVFVNVNPRPPAPTVPADNVQGCAGQSVTLRVNTEPNTNYLWNGPAGFNAAGASAIVSNLSITRAGIYSVVAIRDNCSSLPTAVEVLIIPNPGPPTASDISGCMPATYTFTAFMGTPPGNEIRLYTTPTGGLPIATDNTAPYELTTPNLTQNTVFYLESVLSAQGCVSSRTPVSVIQTSPPTFTASNSGLVCEGQSIQLFASFVPNASYLWQGPDGFSTTEVNPIRNNVTTAMSGVYTCTVTVPNCPPVQRTTTVQINPSPQNLRPTSNSPVCQGQTLFLNAPDVPRATFLWQGPGLNSSEANVQIRNVQPANAGMYTLTINTLDCGAFQQTLSVVVNPQPANPVFSTKTYCPGEVIKLEAPTPFISGATYSWRNQRNDIISNEPIHIIPNAASGDAGVYSLRIELPGCIPAIGNQTIIVHPDPAQLIVQPETTFACRGRSFTLTANQIPGATYNWIDATGTPGSISPSFTIESADPLFDNGNFILTVQVANCAPRSFSYPVLVQEPPVVPLPCSNAPICASATLELSAYCGTSAQENTTYFWEGPQGVIPPALQTQPSLQLPNVPAGNHLFRITVKTGTGCPPASSEIRVLVGESIPDFSLDNTAFCQGEPINLSPNPLPSLNNASYTWNTPNMQEFNTPTLFIPAATSANAGVYSLTIETPGCAPVQRSGIVTVYEKVDGQITSSVASPLCEGTSTVLTFVPNNVVPPNTTYQWLDPTQSILSSTTSIQSLSSPMNGFYTVRVSSICSNLEKQIRLQVIPANLRVNVATIDTPLCEGQSTELRGTLSTIIEQAQYRWLGPQNTVIGSTQSITLANLTTANTGSYIFEVTIPDAPPACSLYTAGITLEVSRKPLFSTIATNQPTYCVGNTLSLILENPTPNATYLWSGPDNFSSTESSPSRAALTTEQAGVYSLLITTPSCPPLRLQSPFIEVYQTPILEPLPDTVVVCEGEPITWQARITPNYANAIYEWRAPGGDIINTSSILTLGTARITDAGTYSLRVLVPTAPSACGFVSQNVVLVVSPRPRDLQVVTSPKICRGSTLSLALDRLIPGASYTWSGPNNFRIGGTQVEIANIDVPNSGIYSVTVQTRACPTLVVESPFIRVYEAPSITASVHQSRVCEGQPLIFNTSAIPNPKFSWIGPSGFSSTSQNPIIQSATVSNQGVYTVTAIDTLAPSGCNTATANVSVTIIPAPRNPGIQVNTPICVGNDLLFTLSNPQAEANYTWSGPANFSFTGVSPTINNAQLSNAGIYTLIITTGEECTPLTVFSQRVEINSPPTGSLSSNSPVCVGGTIILRAPNLSNATYLWVQPNNETTTTTLPIFTLSNVRPNQSGNYLVTVTIPGCPPLPLNTNVLVNQVPIISLSTSDNKRAYCRGEDITLSASLLGNHEGTYIWSGPEGFASNELNSTIFSATTQASGIYSFTARIPGCDTVTQTIRISVSEPPAYNISANATLLCQGGILQLSATSISNASYQWSGPGGFSSVLSNVSRTNVQPNHSGVYRVVVTVPGCAPVAQEISITINPLPVAVAASNSPICQGSNLSLSGNYNPSVAGATFSWNGPLGWSSNEQNPILNNLSIEAAGNYTFTVTVPGCSPVSATTAVFVNRLPTVNVTSNSPICNVRSFLQFTATVTPENANYTFSWSGPNNFSSTQKNPSITNISNANAGTYALSVSTPGCGSVTATTVVTITELPSRIDLQTNSPVCIGGTLRLTATSVPTPAIYEWRAPGGFVTTTSDPNWTIPNFTENQIGEYSVTLTVLGCPETRFATAQVQITPVVSVSNSSPVCVGGTLRLTAIAPSGSTFRWLGPGGLTSTEQGAVFENITLANAGVYTLIVNVPGNSCGEVRLHTFVIVNSQAATVTASNNGPICAGQTLRLSTTGLPGAFYLWSGPNGFSSTQQIVEVPNAQVSNTGTYTLRATPVGCSTVVASTVAVVHPVPRPPIVQGETTVCAGSTLQLTVASERGVEYTWQTPDGLTINDAILLRQRVTTQMAGVYALYTKLGSCSSEVVLTRVNVLEIPELPTVASNSPVCAGGTLQLSASNTSTQGISYQWLGPNGFNSNEQNPRIENVNTTNAGIYTLVASRGNCRALPATINVLVNGPIPPVSITQNSPLCEGATLRLVATQIPGAAYSWVGPNGFNSTSSNITLAGVGVPNGGIYEVSVQLPGCAPVTVSTEVIINRAPGKLSIGNNGPICEGESLTLNLTSATNATYNWSGPNGFSSTENNPIIPSARSFNSGNYSVTVTVPGCAPASLITTARVKPQPAAPIITTNSPVCSGSNLVLGIANLLPDAIYYWQDPAGNTSFSTRLIRNNVSTLDAGNYSVFAVLEGCTSATTLQNVQVLEVPTLVGISTNSPICQGNTLIVEVDVIPNAQYIWNGPNNFSATTSSFNLTNVTTKVAGMYSLNLILGNCTSRTFTTNIVVNTPPRTPVVASNSPICSGEQLNLSISTQVGAFYEWVGPAGFSSTIANPIIPFATTNNAGVYTVTVTVPGCSSAIGTTNVIVNSIPSSIAAISNAPICVGTTLNLSVDNIPGATYQWSGPNGFSSSLASPTLANVTLSQAGAYSVVVRIGNCSTLLTATTNVIINVQPRITITQNSPVCEGNTLVLTASPQNSAFNYSWVGPNNNSGNSAILTITNATLADAGIYTLNVTVPGCSASQAIARTVVNPNANSASITNNSPVCVGQNISLVANGIPSNATLSWQGPNSFRSSVPSPSFLARSTAQAGIYTLNILIPGCTARSITTEVVINSTPSLPVPTANSPLCEGGELILRLSPESGATYLWSGPANFDATGEAAQISNITQLNAGTYSVVGYIGNCTSAVATINVEVYPIPATPSVISTQSACLTNDVQLTASSATATRYYWQGPSGFASTLQNPIVRNFTPDKAGFYSVVAIANNCTSQAAQTEVVGAAAADISVITGDTVLCEGGILSLGVTPTPGAIYTWRGPNNYSSTGNSFAIVDVLPNQGGVYTLTAILGTCTSRTTRNVRVIRKPPAPRLFSNAPLCAGSTLQLSSDGPANALYIWQGPAGFFSMESNPTRTNITPQHAGTYVLQMFADDCPAPAVSINVTVIGPSAVFDTPDMSICQGESITVPVVAQGVPAWVVNYTANGVQQNPIIVGVTGTTNVVLQPTQTTTYVINDIRDGSTCQSTYRDTLIVTVISRPTSPRVITNAPVCVGSALALSIDSPNPNLTYLWRGPNNFSHTGTSRTLQNVGTLNGGVYSAVAVQGNCSSVITRVNVVVNSGPTANITNATATVCAQQPYPVTVNLSGTPPWNLSYQISGGATVTVSNITSSPYILNITPANTGNFTYTLVDVTDGSGCRGTVNGALTLNVIARPSLNVVSKTDASCGGRNARLEVRASGGSGSNYLYSLDGTNFSNTTGIFTDLAAGTYTVSVKDGNCISAISVVINSGVSPTTITSSSGGSGSISLTWQDLAGVAGYNLRYRVANSGSSYQTITNITGNNRTITGLLPNTTYEVQIQTVCANGSVSVWSSPVNVTTLAGGASTCAMPTNLSFHTLRSTSLTLTWNGPANTVCYVVSYGNFNTDPSTWLQVLVPGNTISITGLTPGTTYGYRIRANCSSCSATAGNLSSWSNISTFTTPVSRESDVQEIEINSARGVWVYPNPSKGSFYISFQEVPQTPIMLRLLDKQGRAIEKRILDANNQEKTVDIQLRDYVPGLYLLEVTLDRQVYRIKLVLD